MSKGFVLIVNVPGYMPDSEPVEYDTICDAWRAARDDFESRVDDAEIARAGRLKYGDRIICTGVIGDIERRITEDECGVVWAYEPSDTRKSFIYEVEKVR